MLELTRDLTLLLLLTRTRRCPAASLTMKADDVSRLMKMLVKAHRLKTRLNILHHIGLRDCMEAENLTRNL